MRSWQYASAVSAIASSSSVNRLLEPRGSFQSKATGVCRYRLPMAAERAVVLNCLAACLEMGLSMVCMFTSRLEECREIEDGFEMGIGFDIGCEFDRSYPTINRQREFLGPRFMKDARPSGKLPQLHQINSQEFTYASVTKTLPFAPADAAGKSIALPKTPVPRYLRLESVRTRTLGRDVIRSLLLRASPASLTTTPPLAFALLRPLWI